MHVPAQPSPAAEAASAARPSALVLRRLLSLCYDLLPVVALWMLAAIPFVLLDVALHGGDTRHNIEPFSLMSWLLWSACWAVTGLYATVSWRRGGQTLGMRPWRLRLRTADGAPPSWRALWLRYAVGTLSLLAGGLGFWWAWFDRGRLAWHDRASGTGLERLPKRKK
ncbi:RDD family protein [Pseudoxanthomonas sp. SGNA-20]|uniref:RDD family protein n=1 Tax=Pseudoxanthomonas sp. SGNA-20 TaxID=2493088 RepID=UPI000F62EAFD|nr:RDD family protein [Pseudoxanthomonas sp. SGNA-20]RRN56396.1 RDD family protein [Pseudoxanthomonas sp. SGNA-20]